MPNYLFHCDEENGGCGNRWETQVFMSEISNLHPKCKNCRKQKTVIRDWSAENVGMQMTCTTLGAYAERKTNRMSVDEKTHLHKQQNSYKDKNFAGKLPDGAKLYDKDSRGKPIASKKQRKKNESVKK